MDLLFHKSPLGDLGAKAGERKACENGRVLKKSLINLDTEFNKYVVGGFFYQLLFSSQASPPLNPLKGTLKGGNGCLVYF